MSYSPPQIELEADLVVDTAVEGRQPGVRGGDRPGDRRLLYRSGDLFLDLRFSRSSVDDGRTVMGQLLGGFDAEPLAELPVWLDREGEPPIRTTSDRLGEFWMLCDRHTPTSLGVQLERQIQLEVPFPPDLFGPEGGTP